MHSFRNSGSDVKDQDFDLKLKLLILGKAAVGKTCFLVRYTDGIFRFPTRLMLNADLTYKEILRNDKKVKLEIWDSGKVFPVAFIVKTALKELSSQLYIFNCFVASRSLTDYPPNVFHKCNSIDTAMQEVSFPSFRV